MKMSRCLVAVMMVLVTGTAWANLSEDFEGYSTGQFTSQTSAWSGSSDWQIVDDGGNKVLKLPSPLGDLPLMYTPESFSAGTGYTLMLKMKAEPGSPWVSKYSGWVCDADSASPTASDHAYRFYPTDGSQFFTIGGSGISDSYGIPFDTWTYFRQYRSGDNVKIYVSSSPIDALNPGTLIIDDTVPALGSGGNSLGLYGAGTVYYDNVVFAQGNYIPEPATVVLLCSGVGLLGRRKS